MDIASEIFEYNFDLEEMMSEYAPEVSRNIVFPLVIRRMISHLLTVAFETLTRENMLFRILFNRFPETEYTTPTIMRHDLTVDRVYDKLNEHLQSNDQISAEGVWNGYMVVSRLVMDRRRNVNRPRNVNRIPNANDNNLLEGRGKLENYSKNIGLVNVMVDQNCLGHVVLLSMSMADKGELYRAFLAGFDRYLNVLVQERLYKVENSRKVLSRLGDMKKYSMKKLHRDYLKDKNFDLCVYTKSDDEKPVKVYNSASEISDLKKVILYHNENHFDIIQNLGIYLYSRKVPFCERCMRKVKDGSNHVCYSSFRCFKCKFQHWKNFDMLGHVVCPLCNCAFNSEFCLRSHYVKSVNVGIVKFEGKIALSPCSIYFYCEVLLY